ncbi:tetratricopeptide repeat protein [Asticcacaulis sp.]|uniref:tetratricopeptide repeat protein n=1 Tax=Asticcacaulis sp. TaxID=1872648 RepID=UPI0026111B5F|nr:tetratricopeptide repeat protein [Asticcacaulis sp.]
MMRNAPMVSCGTAGKRADITEGCVEHWRDAVRLNTVLNYRHHMASAFLDAHDHAALIAELQRLVTLDPRQYGFAATLLVRLNQQSVRDHARAATEYATVSALQAMVEADPDRYGFALRVIRQFEGAAAREWARAALDEIFAGEAEDQAMVLLDEAEAAHSHGEGSEAVALTRRALSLDPGSVTYRPQTVIMVAGELRRNSEEALRWCDLAAPHADDMFDILHQKGFSYLLLNRQMEAQRDLLASLALAPERMSSWYVLGQFHRLRFEDTQALECYWRVRNSTDPLRVWAGLMIGYTHLLHDRLREAMEICDHVRAEHPWMKWALIIRGLVHLRAGDLDAAEHAINEGRRDDPDTLRARVFHGLIGLARHRPSEALADFNGECGDFACHALPRLGRARALLDLKQMEEAKRLIADAVREESQWIAVTLRLLGPSGEALMPLLIAAGFGG